MSYAILQTSDQRPSREQLAAAFTSVDFLTALDAPAIARDAYGIVVENLGRSDALKLGRALDRAGVGVEVVEQSRLAQLPPRLKLRRATFTADEMVLFDTLDRPTPLAWERVMAFAAGRVEGLAFAENAEQAISKDEDGHTVWSHKSTKERNETTLLADLLLDVEPYRYQMAADHFLYGYLGDRRTSDSDANFLQVIRDVCRFARLAVLNRGAREVIETGRLPHGYPSRHAYEEELTWMLWKLQKKLDGTA